MKTAWIATICGLMLLTAPGLVSPVAAASEDGEINSNVYGDYLSARFATINRDAPAAADFYIRAVASDPFNIPVIRQAFTLSVAAGRIDDAVRLARRLSDLNEPATGLMELVLLVGDLQQQSFEAARTRASVMNTRGIVGLMAPLVTAWIQADEGDVDGALVTLDTLQGTRGFAPFMKTHRAYILDYTGRIAEARTAYADAIAAQRQPDLRLVLSYGRFLERIDDADAAARVYDDYMQNYPSNVLIEAARARAETGEKPLPLISSITDGAAEAFFSTGSTLAQERSRASAVVYLQLARWLRPDFPVANLLLGTVLEQDGHYDVALKAYQQVMPDPILGWDARFEAAMLLGRMERPEDSIAKLKNMLSERPDDLTIVTSLADTLRVIERYDEARGYYDQVVAALDVPLDRHWGLFYSRGIVLERLGEWPAAEADFRRALTLAPDQPLVLNYLGYTMVEKGQNLGEALEMIEKAVEQRPDDGYIIDSLGWALYKLGQYEEATGWLEKAVQLRPEDPTINDHLGDAYWKTGRRLEATFQWRHALAMKPEKEDALRIREKIASGLDASRYSSNGVSDQ